MPHFPKKWFQLRHSKIYKTLENYFFKHSEHLFFSSRQLQNHFLRSFLWPNFDLNSLERFTSLFQKMISTSSLKNLQKTEKCSIQTLTTFVFEPKVTSKPFSKKLPVNEFWFKEIWTLCLTFPEKDFNFVTQKYTKTWKMLFSNAQNIHFWAQSSFKTIF